MKKAEEAEDARGQGQRYYLVTPEWLRFSETLNKAIMAILIPNFLPFLYRWFL